MARRPPKRAAGRPDAVRRRRRVAGWAERIVCDPAVLVGKPVVRGTRLAVEFIVELLSHGWTEAEILQNYPGLSHEDVLACLAYAHDVLSSEEVHPLP